MDILFLSLQASLIYGLAGISVRAAMTVSGGFDLVVAIAALASAEVIIAFANALEVKTVLGYMGVISIGLVSAGLLGVFWSAKEKLFGLKKLSSLSVFIGSFGALIIAIGLVGILRGPGLKTIEGSIGQTWDVFGTGHYIGSGTFVGLVVGCIALLLSSVWLRSRRGYALRLYAMNPSFAQEVGVDGSSVVKSGTIFACVCAGVAGSIVGIVGGSTPELGMTVFLYGVGAALLFESKKMLFPLVAGLLFGIMQVGTQLILAPAWTQSLMFALIVVILLFRGTSRELSDVR